MPWIATREENAPVGIYDGNYNEDRKRYKHSLLSFKQSFRLQYKGLFKKCPACRARNRFVNLLKPRSHTDPNCNFLYNQRGTDGKNKVTEQKPKSGSSHFTELSKM